MSLKAKLFKSLSWIFYKISTFFLLRAKGNLKDSLKEFWAYLDSQMEGGRDVRFEAQNRGMIESILGLQDTIVREIMVPRTDLAVVRMSDSIDKAISLIREKGRSRIPVFEEKIDNIVGVLYAKDILRYVVGHPHKEVTIEKLMRAPNFVPETKNVVSLLQEMRLKKFHLAIVIDEYGGTAGLVTMEDLIEEIIGEVQDEYDREEEKVVQIDSVSWRVDAKISLEDLNDALEIELPREEDYDTLAGYILYRLGKIPDQKEKVEFEEWRFIVVESDEKSIEKVKIVRKEFNDSEEVKGKDMREKDG